jgi:hypothetical protein
MKIVLQVPPQISPSGLLTNLNGVAEKLAIEISLKKKLE